ncbi:stage II sporulation protein M [Thermococcus camini]|uniref:Membrane protein, conserved n=1 Tax=Thermococcus camini TaxID=2016373 RepID=A0A7G2D764_9EURY|nr:stage II sporulation protein M [Thermococcus camini]CAD5244031.1 Membrane protein, conserved [Thermococcus camini]
MDVLDVKVPKRTMGHLLLVFILSALGGYWAGAASPDTALEAVRRIIEQIGPISDSSFHNFVKIFTNNSMVALLTFISGLFFGLGPWLIMAFNGFVVGLVVLAVHRMGGMPMGQILLGLVPHGVVEIPAIALAGVAGIVWYREIISGEGEGGERFRRGAVKGLKLFALSVLFLFVAALIEAYVTPRVAGL